MSKATRIYTSIRAAGLAAVATLAIFAGSAISNPAQAQYNDGTDSKIVECGDAVTCGVAAVVVYKHLEWQVEAIDDCVTRNAGKPGRNLGAGQTLVWFGSSDATKAKRKAEDAAYAASPAARVMCDKATVASKAELQADRFAMFGIDPGKAAMTAQAEDLGAKARRDLTFAYLATQPNTVLVELR